MFGVAEVRGCSADICRSRVGPVEQLKKAIWQFSEIGVFVQFRCNGAGGDWDKYVASYEFVWALCFCGSRHGQPIASGLFSDRINMIVS